jgi:hypothetical protein
MQKEGKQVSRRWRTAAVLALGVVIGTMLLATSAGAHVGGTVSHLWNDHIKPKADARYANAVAGTDKAKNANNLDGIDSLDLINRASNTRADHQDATPVTLAEYPSLTDVVQTSITTRGASSQVLIVGQFTAQNTSSNSGDVFAQALADGTVVDGLYWASLGATSAPVFPRAQLAVSRVITLGPGLHTITLQGDYYDGGTDRSVAAYARSISAVELN